MNLEEIGSSRCGKWKELVAGLLAVSISFTAFSSVALAKIDKKEKGNKADVVSSSKELTQEEYDKEQLEGYLTGAGYTEEDNLKISQKFSTDENTEISYVFSGDDVIGSYTTTEVDGEKLSSFTFNSTSDEIKSIYEISGEAQELQKAELGSVIIDEVENTKTECKSIDTNELVKEAYKKGKRIGFRNCEKGQVFFYGKHADFMSGEKQGKKYNGVRGSFSEKEAIELKSLNAYIDLGTNTLENDNYYTAIAASHSYGLVESNNYKFYLYQDYWNQDGRYLGHYGYDRDGAFKPTYNCEYGNIIPSNLGDFLTSEIRKENAISSMKGKNGISQFAFCPVPLRKNLCFRGDNPNAYDHWSYLEGKLGGKGLCWCASMASVISYLTNKSYSTKDLYLKLYSDFTKFNSRYIFETDPQGSNEWMLYGLNNVGLLNYKLTQNYTRLNNTCVKENLSKGYPIIMGIGDYNVYDKNKNVIQRGAGGFHFIVLCGTYKKDNKLYYVYMDPNNAKDHNNNNKGYVVNNIPNYFWNRTDEKFYVNLQGGIFNTWGKVYSYKK